MKKCPYCFEDIQDQAIKCRFCMEMLSVPEASVKPIQPEVKPDTIIAEIDAHLKAGEDFENRAGGIPEAVNHYFLAAQLSLESGNEEDCQSFCEHILELNPDNSRATSLLASIDKDVSASVSTQERATAPNVEASADFYEKAEGFRKSGHSAEAFRCYLEAVKLDPDNRQAHFGVKMYVPDHSVPAASVQKAVATTTTNLPARIKPVSKKSKIDEHLKAAEDYESQPDGKFKAVKHYLAAAKLYLDAGNAKFCRELCEHVLELSPSNSKASALLASVAFNETVESEEEDEQDESEVISYSSVPFQPVNMSARYEPRLQGKVDETLYHNGKPVGIEHVASVAVIGASTAIIGTAGLASTVAVGWLGVTGCSLMFPGVVLLLCFLAALLFH